MRRRLLNLSGGRHVFRHLFALCAAGSGVVLVVVLAIWVRSYFRADTLIYQPRADEELHLYRVSWVWGRLSMGRFAAENQPISRLYWGSFVPGPPRAATPDPNEFRFLSVRLYRGTEYIWHQSSVRHRMPDPPFTPVREFGASLPCWQAAALSACMPAHWLLLRRRRQIGRRRAERGHCVRCGYDLRASTGRCPECGAIP